MASQRSPRIAKHVDVATPDPARVYDYLVGGTENYLVDRQAAERVLAKAPGARLSALRNREFLGRVVRWLAEQGIDQFLDIGSGLPTQDNVHQVAQRINPDARVVYVDNSASVHAHAVALLSGNDRTAFVQADVRNVESIVSSPEFELWTGLARWRSFSSLSYIFSRTLTGRPRWWRSWRRFRLLEAT